jgi:hypothetical protein
MRPTDVQSENVKREHSQCGLILTAARGFINHSCISRHRDLPAWEVGMKTCEHGCLLLPNLHKWWKSRAPDISIVTDHLNRTLICSRG